MKTIKKNKQKGGVENDDILKFLNDIPVLKNLPVEKIKEEAKKYNLTETLNEVLEIWNNKAVQNFITNPANIKTLASGNMAEKIKLGTKFATTNPMLALKIGGMIKKYSKLISLVKNIGNIGISIPTFGNENANEANTANAANAASTTSTVINETQNPSIVSRNAPPEGPNDASSKPNMSGDTSNNQSKNGKSFDIDASLNKALYYLIVFIVFVMIGIAVVVVAILSIYNYVTFSYYTMYEFLISSDEINAEKLFIRDTYSFKLLNYIFCQGQEDMPASKDCGSSGVGYYIEYFFRMIIPADDCDSESKVYIYGLNRFFNFCMKLFYLIFIIIFIQLLAYIIIYAFLGGLRNYEIKGQTMFSYLTTRGILYVYIMLLIFVYCLAHAIHFKFSFIDNVYDRIFKIYEEYRKLDLYVNGEAKAIEGEKAFLNFLITSSIYNIGNDAVATTYNHKDKIIEEIKDSDSMQVQSTKLFLYTLYRYVVEHNNGSDVEIVKKLNEVVLQKVSEGDTGPLKHTMREFFKLNIDTDTMKNDINNIVIAIGSDIAAAKNKATPKPNPEVANQFTGFNFETDASATNTTSVKYHLATKLSAFYRNIETSSQINFDDVIYYMNMHIIIEWIVNAVFILLILLVIYFNQDQSPLIKRFVILATALIVSIIDEIKTGLLGI